MKYYLTDHLGKRNEESNLENLKKMMKHTPFNEWEKGSGDSAISFSDTNEQLIFFKLEKGVFIMQHPDYLVPMTENRMQQKAETLTHYVGGNEMSIPNNSLFSEEDAFEVLSIFAENKELSNKYKWIDLYEIEFDHGF
ncbi:hypothetical protein [uncultured Aquimarina sp.]|uniref:hypothetical protein n=1 Tax=uncultured Aquimarina sp. TaxID=575652 RepID=UPI00263631D4|nr:hypothetical protein [uncultured Aquimarina sp.]